MTKSAIPNEADKTRNHLANERTFLAWVRTSLSIIVFGFVVAKFGVILREFLFLQNQNTRESSLSLVIGIGFMIMGIIMSILSLVRYKNTMYRIESAQFEPSNGVIVFLSLITALFGFILVIYLISTIVSG